MNGKEKLAKALEYAGHRNTCAALQPMWHRGPYDYGWEDARELIEHG